MRAITMAVPSLTISMEVDGQDYEVRGLKTKSPYVKVSGVRHPLTKLEIQYARELMKVFKDWGKQ